MEEAAIQGFLLSPQQKRLWLLQRGGVEAYSSHCALRIEGELDRGALCRCLGEVVSRHEILRTAFRAVPGMDLPLQVILDPEPPLLREVDLSGLDRGRQEARVEELLGGAGRPAFDLERGVVFLASLVRLAESEHLLLLALPTLCADTASFSILLAEIAASYARLRGGEPPMQYADLADWQNQLLESAESKEHLDRWLEYWQEHEIASQLEMRLPFEESGPAAVPFEPASLAVPLPLDLVEGIERLLQDWAVQGPDFFLACWLILLRRGTGKPDVLVGTLHDGRRYEELQAALGPLARYLPVHCRLPETLVAREVVESARAAVEEVARRQERFSWLHLPGRNGAPAGRSFFPVCFEAIEDPPAHAVDGLRFSLARRRGVLDRYKLKLACIRRGNSHEIELRYDPVCFRRDSVELLAERFRTLLRSVVSLPGAPLGRIEMLGARELRLLGAFSRSEAPTAPRLRQGQPIHRLFELQARSVPDRPAIWNAGAHLTYAELDARANRLAHHLISLGIGLETPVAICFERSAEMVVAILGILKAGGAWVPLDPTHPPERISFLLASLGVPLVLTRESLLAALPPEEARSGARVLCLDREAGAIDRRSPASPGGQVPEGALAYAIFTSGSTGRPKGVLVEHRSAVHLLAGLEAAALPEPGIDPLRASLNAPLAFDASVQQLVLLLAGHTLFLIPEELRTDGAALVGFLRDHALDLFDCTPSQLRLLLAGDLLETAGPVPRTVLVAGEPIDELTWAALAGSRRTAFFNVYGPTECTVDATAHRIGTLPDASIGRPLAGYSVHLLDAGLRPVPLGAPGELVIGGAGVARGYAGRPDLTAERFVPDPCGGANGGRLYRTGDLACFQPSGHLVFLGRVDHQVKIRGYRIEPGEIEVALRDHPWVREAAVVARSGSEGPILVAWLLPAPEAPPGFDGAPGDLHAFLRRRLPVYMVPSLFVAVPTLPLTGSGKVDRQALVQRPLPERKGRSGVPRVAPASAAEQALVEIWQEILQVDEVSTADNFFELGGDSILCIQIVSRARRAGLWLAPRDLFQNQTIAELALVAQTAPRAAASEPEEGDIPLTPVQRSLFERRPEDLHHFNQALVLALREKVAPGLLERALAAVVAHHTALRLRFLRQEEGGWRQTLADTEAPLQRVDLSSLPAARRAAALETVAARLQTSLDIEQGPLLRAALFDLGEGGQRLFLVAHHLIVDAVSWRILIDDLGTACRAAAAGDDIVLPPVITSLRQWVVRLAEHARSAAGATELAYWLALRETPVRPLPVDRESGSDTVASARHLMAELSEEETRELLRDVPAVYRTRINDVLLTALVRAFAAWTGAPRLLVDLEGHGREDLFDGIDLSRTVGWLTAVHPVLLELDPRDTGPGEQLKSIKEQLRAVPRGGLGYGILLALGEETVAERLRALPAAQVVFNYLGQLDRGLPASSLFAPAPEPAGPSQSWRQRRPWLLEINGGVTDGRLRLAWTYSENRHDARTIQWVIDRFLDALRALIACCRTAEAGFTPSDFPEALVSREDLDRLLARLGGRQRDIESLCELSPMQQALLFHSLYAPGSGVYVMQISLRLAGRLDVSAFLRSWQRVIERHGLLRTGFVWEELEKPLQVVYQRAGLPVERASWDGLDAAEQRARLAAYRDEDRGRGFDMETAPLMRLALFDLGPQEHQLVWTQHHLVSDGWSQGLLLGELFTCYGAFVAGREPVLRPERSFRDYIGWLQRQDLAEAEAFWRRRLAGFVAPTLLTGGDGRGAARPDLRDPRQRLAQVPATTMAALRELARRHHLTLNTLVEGAWSLLLAQATGRDEVIFGNTVAGRPPELPGVESIFGPFINTLPARVAIDPGLRLLPWLADLQERQAEARHYEYAPLSQIQSWSGLPPGVALFDHILVFENYPLDEVVAEGLPGLTISEVSSSELTHYPLSMALLPGAELLLEMTWDGGRFDAATVIRLLERLQGLLRAFAEDPRRRLCELPLLLPEERHQLLLEWNEDVSSPGPCASFLDLFERQVDRAPDALALSSVDGRFARLTYGELDRRANRLANRLRRLGVATDMRVAVLAERSPELIVSFLGILKAGGAYVPLDPAYPPERLAFMLEDLGPAVLVLDEAEGLESESAARPPRDLDAGQIAYVLYTSGSTGRPKGVLVPHGSLDRFAKLVISLYGIRPGDRILQFCSTSFDASLEEIAGTLSSGAELVLRTDAMLESVAVFLETCREQEVTVWDLPTAYWHEITTRLASDGLALPSGLRLVIIGGERALYEQVVAWRRHAPEQPRLLNTYGVTEATISSSCGDLALASAAELRGEVSIGRAVPGTDLYLLDRAGRPVPIGAAGELYVGGLLARGYLNRPDLTAGSFVPHPFSPAPGARLYRTGDLGRALPDGALEFLGRSDRQVKVRGYRIEIEEIEVRLLQHPAVESAVVLVREDHRGDRQLVGHVVLHRPAGADLFPLRDWVREALPAYMVPGAFVVLEALPLTSHGKVDRGALLALEPFTGGESRRAPERDPVEGLLAGIWGEVLGRDRVEVHDDFFALGGHSLLATQVMSRLRQVLGVELPLRRLFESPTVAGLARDVREARGAREAGPPVPPIVPVPHDGDLPLSFAQQRLWFLDQLEPGSAAYNLPSIVRLMGDLSVEALEQAFAEVVRRHETLRTIFAVEAGQPVQVKASPEAARPELRVFDLSDAPEEAREEWARELALEESRHPFDLQKGPLLRLGLLRLSEQEHLLLVNLHHIVSDAWSMGVLVRELGALYPAFVRGEPSPLPDLAVQYADFALWQRSWLQGEVLERQLAFVKTKLAGAPMLLDLPTDRPRSAMQTYRGASVGRALSPTLSAAIHDLCRKEGVTPFMLFLAAWTILLGRHAGQEDLLVGSPIAGRNHREIEDLIGFFVNTLVLRSDLSGDPAFGELLRRVRETALDAFAHQELPFELLVDALSVERSLAHAPLIQVLLTLQNAPIAPIEALRIPALTFSPVDTASTTAKFDLSVVLGETAEGFAASLEHATDLFDHTTAERYLGHFANLLASAVESPGRPLSALRLMDAAEEQMLRAGLHRTERTWALPVMVHDLFTRQAGRTPDRVVAVGPQGTLTYGELDERARALAALIRKALTSVPLDRRIALLADPDPQVLIGMIGILKAGGGFVPIDSRHPDERLAGILEDSGCEVLVTDRRHLERARGMAGLRHILCLDEEMVDPSRADTGEPGDPLIDPGALRALAYVVYTSGSTGRPKGVQVSHESLVPMLLWGREYFGLGEHTRVLQSLSFCFDFGIFEHLTTVIAGGTLFFPGEAAGDPEAFARQIARYGIDTLHTTPAFARELAALGRLDSLRIFHLGGEALAPDTVARLHEAAPRATLYNGYGPTEATINSSIFRIGAEACWPVVPIGRRSADNVLYVLDRAGRLAPLGARGELYVGGIGVARGYLGRPELTAERFVPDPFGVAPGGRLYRTGDLVRYLTDSGRPGGDLEFLGRIDQQVKLRGFRIELGEIETVLRSHPAVEEAVVQVQDEAGDRRLAAWVVLDRTDPSDLQSALSAWLRGKLPDYMVPAAFVLLDALPLTPTGKVDRRALPAPERHADESIYAEPGDPVEEEMASIWREVLQLDRVGIHDNFFALGGHSLLATQVTTRMRERLGVRLPLRRLFESPTVAQLAWAVREAREAGQ